MATPLVEPVTRAKPVDWLGIVGDALQRVGAPPLAPSLVNTLTTLNSYSAAPVSIYVSPATAMRDIQVHVALLRALDASIGVWPPALRRHVIAPAPDHPRPSPYQPGPDAERLRQPPLLLDGVRPLSEAVLVLYNASVANLEAGLSHLDRVHGDAARLETAATRGDHHHHHSSSSNGGRGPSAAAAPLRAPSVNAKAAYRHLLTAQQLAAGAAALLELPNVDAGAGYNVALSPTELQYLRSLIDLPDLQAFAAVCVATAKYVYSLFSSASAARPDALARLAFAASALPVPVSIAPASVNLLASLLLAAYHRHRAEYYHEAVPEAPDMANALGHIRLAESVLRAIDRQYGSAPPAEPSSAGATPPPSSRSSTWGSRVWSALRALSVSPRRRSGDGEAAPSGSRGRTRATDNEEEEEEAEEEEGEEEGTARGGPGGRCFGNLVSRVRAANDPVTRLFPVLDNLVRRVRELSREYERENSLVYFTKVPAVAVVQADVPSADATEGDNSSAVVPTVVLPHPSSVIDDSVFNALPSTGTLAVHVSVHEQRRRRSEAVQRLNALLSDLKSLALPKEVELALEALQPCCEPHTGSVSNALLVAKAAVREAWERHVEAASRWATARSALMSADGTEGAVEPASLTLSLEADVRCWVQAEAEATQQWVAAVGPFDVASTQSIDAIRHTLVPEADAARAFVDHCTATLSRTLTVALSASAEEEALATVEALQDEARELLRRLAPLYDEGRWEERQAAMRAVALAVWDAPQVVNRLEEGTTRLGDETAEAVMMAAVAAAKSKLKPKPKPKGKRRVSTRGEAKREAVPVKAESLEEECEDEPTGLHTSPELSSSDDREEAPGGAEAVTEVRRRQAAARRKARKSAVSTASGKGAAPKAAKGRRR